ncbi:MAG: hypothetical protein ACKVU2_04540 [Saprospiraceae bacterium]
MQKFFIKGFVAGVILLALSYVSLLILVRFLPDMAEEYYNPVFDMEGNKVLLYFLHPFILSFALAWFWRRFKTLFHGPFWWRGIELGLVYGLIATLPSMWITFSAFTVPLSLVLTWLLYGVFQAIIVGMVYAKISP